MHSRLIPVLAAAAVAATALLVATPATAAEPKLQRVPSKGTTFQKKNGYWTECRYTGLGTVCETVYAKAKNGKFTPAVVAGSKFTRKSGQVMVCYDGSNNAQICYWVYSPRKAP